jgi:hypothetical protein
MEPEDEVTLKYHTLNTDARKFVMFLLSQLDYRIAINTSINVEKLLALLRRCVELAHLLEPDLGENFYTGMNLLV